MPAAQPLAAMDYDNKRFVALLLVLHRKCNSLPQGWTADDFVTRWNALGLPKITLAALLAPVASAVEVCPACDRRRVDPATRSCTRTDCGLALRAVAGADALADQMKEHAA